MAEVMRRLEVSELPGVHIEAVVATGDVPLFGGGRRVGEIRPAF